MRRGVGCVISVPAAAAEQDDEDGRSGGFLGGGGAALSQAADFFGHDGETGAQFPCPRSLDCGVESEQIGLKCDFVYGG